MAPTISGGLAVGESVNVSGICLTVTAADAKGFSATASLHTAQVTTLNDWKVGHKVNLERALPLGGRLGGHLVQGHVDAVGKVVQVRHQADSTVLSIRAPTEVLSLLPPKGSVAVDGVSLTVVDTDARAFKVMLVPHTLDHTTLGELKPGDRVNLETDLVIRFLAHYARSIPVPLPEQDFGDLGYKED